ncbi:MAG: hypothetical protein AAF617_03530, partial [Bacteroidota bacterium]
PLVYGQEILETTIEVAEVTYGSALPEIEVVETTGIPLNTETHENNHIKCCPVFVYSIFAILTLIIVAMVSFRIRKNTLKLF